MAGELGDPAAAANVTRTLRRTLPNSQTIADSLGGRQAARRARRVVARIEGWQRRPRHRSPLIQGRLRRLRVGMWLAIQSDVPPNWQRCIPRRCASTSGAASSTRREPTGG